jgi:hypothetical protein
VCLTKPPDEKENPHENLIIGKIKKSTAHWTTNNFFVGLLPARFVFFYFGAGPSDKRENEVACCSHWRRRRHVGFHLCHIFHPAHHSDG